MIDGVPVQLLNGVGVVGIVVLVGWLFWRALTVVPKDARLPRLVTGREAQTYLDRAELSEANLKTALATTADLTAISQLQKATIEAAFKARGEVIEGEPS